MKVVTQNHQYKELKECFTKTCGCTDKDIYLFGQYAIDELNLHGVYIITNQSVIQKNVVHCGLQYHRSCNRTSTYDLVETRIIYDGFHMLLYHNLTIVKDFTQPSILNEIRLIDEYIVNNKLKFTKTQLVINNLPYIAVHK